MFGFPYLVTAARLQRPYINTLTANAAAILPSCRNVGILGISFVSLCSVLAATADRLLFVQCVGCYSTQTAVCAVCWLLQHTDCCLCSVLAATAHRLLFVQCVGCYSTQTAVCHCKNVVIHFVHVPAICESGLYIYQYSGLYIYQYTYIQFANIAEMVIAILRRQPGLQNEGKGILLCYVILCYVMLCYVMLCCVMLCYVMLYYVMPLSVNFSSVYAC
jgi:hypothetical protein